MLFFKKEIKIDDLVKENENLVVEKQKIRDKQNEVNSKIETKIKELENLAFRNKQEADALVAKITRKIEKNQEQIDLEAKYYNKIAKAIKGKIMNNISIIGRLTKDPELQATNSGIEFTRFNVAVASDIKVNGERAVDFFTCVAWRETAKNIYKYFKKGSPIGLIGSMNSRTYEKQDGGKQIIWELNIKQFSFTGEQQENKGKKETPQQEMIPLEDDSDIPF